MSKKQKSKQSQKQWVVTVVLLSFGLSVVMSVLTSLFVDSAGLLVALIALIVLISIGIITDVIGTAVTSADERPFIAMASKKINGAKQALRLIRKAERVSSILNDVAGDIVGVVSGSAGSVIAMYLVSMGLPTAFASVVITACISAFMIGGKAVGKSFAIEKSNRIVLYVGKAMALFENKKPKRTRRKQTEEETEGRCGRWLYCRIYRDLKM